jgi:hypothetical protein
MKKITGVKSVDFKITAIGYGVVNWNGPTELKGEHPFKPYKNHTMPKLRGYTNFTGEIEERTTAKGNKLKVSKLKAATDRIDFEKNPLYISQNCIRHHLFKNQSFDWHYLNKNNLLKAITSFKGLLNGYVSASAGTSFKRTSALLIEDFVDKLGNGNFEQFSANTMEKITKKDGSTDYKRNENSIFSKTTFGDTKYTSYGSISIEQLQFISLDNKFDRAAMIIKEGQGEEIAQKVQDFIKSLNPDLEPKAVFHQNYVRGGTIFEEGEQGILLDEIAIGILIDETLEMLRNLSIRQAKGYMYVDDLEVDYNDSTKMMRFKNTNAESVNPSKNEDFATYFYAKD